MIFSFQSIFITYYCLFGNYECSDILAHAGIIDIFGTVEVKNKNGKIIVLAHGSSGAVHYRKIFEKYLVECELIVLDSVIILVGVLILNAIYHSSREEEIRLDLGSSQS